MQANHRSFPAYIAISIMSIHILIRRTVAIPLHTFYQIDPYRLLSGRTHHQVPNAFLLSWLVTPLVAIVSPLSSAHQLSHTLIHWVQVARHSGQIGRQYDPHCKHTL